MGETPRIRFVTVTIPSGSFDLPYIVPIGAHAYKRRAELLEKFTNVLRDLPTDRRIEGDVLVVDGKWQGCLPYRRTAYLKMNEASLRRIWGNISGGSVSEQDRELLLAHLSEAKKQVAATLELLTIAAFPAWEA